MGITLFIIGILLLIFLWRFWSALFLQLRTAKTIKNNLGRATQAYCALGLVNELKEFRNKLFEIIDDLLDVNKAVKVALSFKKINIQCFLTDKQIEFLKENFKYEDTSIIN